MQTRAATYQAVDQMMAGENVTMLARWEQSSFSINYLDRVGSVDNRPSPTSSTTALGKNSCIQETLTL